MKIQFAKDTLQKAINALAKVSQNKTSSNLPGAIYITTKNGKVEMQANDYEIGIRITIDANIIEEGTIVLSTRYFQEWVRKTPTDTITLESNAETKQLLLSSESSQFNLITMDPDDFNLVEQIHDENHIDVDGEQFKQMIDLTNYAAANDDDRPIFTGALLEGESTNLTMVATDTHRMAVKKINLDAPMPAAMRILIPTKTLAEVSRLLPTDQPTVVRIIWNRTNVVFLFDTIYLFSRLIEGQYPDYEKVIPSQFDSSAILNSRDFAGAVDRVSLLAKDASYNVIRYDWDEKEVTLSTQNAETAWLKKKYFANLKVRRLLFPLTVVILAIFCVTAAATEFIYT